MTEYSRPVTPPPSIQSTSFRDWLAQLVDVDDVHLVSTFSGTWANAGGVYLSAGYYKDPFGRVYLQGRISGGTSGTAAFTLPLKYRPKGTVAYQVADPAGNSGYVTITSAGVVTPTSTSGTPAVNLDSISFRVV